MVGAAGEKNPGSHGEVSHGEAPCFSHSSRGGRANAALRFCQWGFSSSRAPQAALVSGVLLFCTALCRPSTGPGAKAPRAGRPGPWIAPAVGCRVSTAAPRAARGNFGFGLFWGPGAFPGGPNWFRGSCSPCVKTPCALIFLCGAGGGSHSGRFAPQARKSRCAWAWVMHRVMRCCVHIYLSRV